MCKDMKLEVKVGDEDVFIGDNGGLRIKSRIGLAPLTEPLHISVAKHLSTQRSTLPFYRDDFT